jgi:hypothetical protein
VDGPGASGGAGVAVCRSIRGEVGSMWGARVVRAVGDGECFLLPRREGGWVGTREDRLLTGYQTTLP